MPAYPRKHPDVVETWVEDEVLLYVPATLGAYRLNARASAIWKGCDGQTPVDSLVETSAQVLELLERLSRDGLIEGFAVGAFDRQLTRAAMIQIGAVAATGALIAPLVEQIVLPTAAAASSAPSRKTTPQSAPLGQLPQTGEPGILDNPNVQLPLGLASILIALGVVVRRFGVWRGSSADVKKAKSA